MHSLQSLVRIVPDFPKPWISFKDITPLLSDAKAFQQTIDIMSQSLWEVDKIVALDARWFIFGSAIAYKLWIPFVPIRKAWKLPFDTVGIDYSLEYGENTIEIHADAIHPWEKIALVDDVLATWWTMKASIALIEKLWGVIDSLNFFMVLEFLEWRKQCEGYHINTLLSFSK
jgi:adenine phosphoribosyltransferase